jgi:hypothetical protein
MLAWCQNTIQQETNDDQKRKSGCTESKAMPMGTEELAMVRESKKNRPTNQKGE